MHLVTVLPAWMIADGEYGDLAVGRAAEFGFALEPESVDVGAFPPGFAQSGDRVPVTTISGSVLRPSSQTPTIVDAGTLMPVLHGAAPSGDGVLARGRLVVEPLLWSSDGVLWPLLPDGVRLWSVDRIREVATDSTDLDISPAVSEVDHDAVYLLDLSRP
ncbi:hypothetical protein [Actinomycetospora soli]|uniref:hypothetical protein n=1 Tax=Actinomycetospora soli TaxID=2893887 RepID=UPI001E613F7A|nr:hypothetical protein [Actinomycetospora soli]MCD2186636.1 hypothetical protein [Actinomycetospora soli]